MPLFLAIILMIVLLLVGLLVGTYIGENKIYNKTIDEENDRLRFYAALNNALDEAASMCDNEYSNGYMDAVSYIYDNSINQSNKKHRL